MSDERTIERQDVFRNRFVGMKWNRRRRRFRSWFEHRGVMRIARHRNELMMGIFFVTRGNLALRSTLWKGERSLVFSSSPVSIDSLSPDDQRRSPTEVDAASKKEHIADNVSLQFAISFEKQFGSHRIASKGEEEKAILQTDEDGNGDDETEDDADQCQRTKEQIEPIGGRIFAVQRGERRFEFQTSIRGEIRRNELIEVESKRLGGRSNVEQRRRRKTKTTWRHCLFSPARSRNMRR